MKQVLATLARNEQGQDLIEYTLLIAYIMIATTAMLIANGGGVQGILTVTTTNLNAANKMSS